MIADKWDQRIRRAGELAARYSFAAEGLRFYERLAGFQKSLYTDLAVASGPAKQVRPPGSLRDELELFLLLPRFASFLSFVEEIAPPPLAQAAAELSDRGGMRWEEVLDEFWRAEERGAHRCRGADRLDLPATLRRASRRSHRAAGDPRHAAALPALLRQAAGRSPEAAGGRRQALADLLALRDGVGLPADRLPRVRRGGRRQAPRLHRRGARPRPRRGLRHLPSLHQDDRPDEGRQGGTGGGRAGGDPPQPVGGGEPLHEAEPQPAGPLSGRLAGVRHGRIAHAQTHRPDPRLPLPLPRGSPAGGEGVSCAPLGQPGGAAAPFRRHRAELSAGGDEDSRRRVRAGGSAGPSPGARHRPGPLHGAGVHPRHDPGGAAEEVRELRDHRGEISCGSPRSSRWGPTW